MTGSHRAPRHAADDRDRGSTLIEMVLAVVLCGILMAAGTAATRAVVTQSDNVTGRLDNAGAEQRLASWLPADLASAQTVDLAPSASPCMGTCPTGVNLAGSNGVMLAWQGDEVRSGLSVTVSRAVSYRYREGRQGYELVRLACTSTPGAAVSCTERSLVASMPPPPNGTTFVAGSTSPSWAISTSAAVDPTSVDANDPTPTARKVVVNLDGGGARSDLGTGAAADGGVKQITFSGAAVSPQPVDQFEYRDPWYPPIASRCSGTIGLIVDNSNSIGRQRDRVRSGVNSFVDAFAGTPVKVKVVTFAADARTITRDGTSYSYYWDMMDPAQVTDLKARLDGMTLRWGTNWEDAIFRMFKDPAGQLLTESPDRVVFFTDGAPYGHMALEHRRATFWSSTDRLLYSWDDLPYVQGGVEDLNDLDIEPDDSDEADGSGTVAIDPNDVPRLQPRPNLSMSMRTIGLMRAVRIMNEFDTDVPFVVVGVGPALDGKQPMAVKGRGFRLDSKGKRVYRTPFTAYERLIERPLGRDVLRRLLTDSGNAVVEADLTNGVYTNARTANFYPLPDFTMLGKALKSVALAQCGGTVTLQTKLGGTRFKGEVQYQNSFTSQIAVTSDVERYANVDLNTPDGQTVQVSIEPVPTPSLDGYTLDAWTCTSGTSTWTPPTVDAPNSPWDGILLDINLNAAVSCTMKVKRA